MAAHEDRLALVAELDDQVLHLAGADRVQAGGGLVEHDQLGVVDQGLGQADAAGHALAVFLQLPPLGPVQPDHLDQVGHPLAADRPRHVEQPAVEIERLLGVEEAVEVRFLGQVADPLVLGHFGGVAAEDQGLAAGGEQQAEDQLDGGGLARAVGPEQPEDFAPADFQVQGLQGPDLLTPPEIAINLGETSGFDDDFGLHGGPFRGAPRIETEIGHTGATLYTPPARRGFTRRKQRSRSIHYRASRRGFKRLDSLQASGCDDAMLASGVRDRRHAGRFEYRCFALRIDRATMPALYRLLPAMSPSAQHEAALRFLAGSDRLRADPVDAVLGGGVEARPHAGIAPPAGQSATRPAHRPRRRAPRAKARPRR